MNAKIMRWSKTHTITLAILALTLALGFVLWRNVLHSIAQTAPQCPASGFVVGVPTNTVSGNIIIPISAMTSLIPGGVTATGASLNSSTLGFLGNAEQVSGSGSNGSYWRLQLATALLPNGAQPVYATIYLSNGNSCTTNPTPLSVMNPTQTSNLLVNLNPPSVNIGTNSSINYSAVAYVQGQTPIDITKYAGYDWIATSGTIQGQSQGVARLFTGPNATNGTTKVTVKYAGKTVQATSAFVVTASGSSSGSSGSGASGSGSTPSSSTPTATQSSSSGSSNSGTNNTPLPPTLATSPEVQAQLAATVQDCASSVIGADRAVAIKNGQSRPTSEEVEKLKSCFAQTNYIVPSTFAPVAPKELANLPQSSIAKVTGLTNGTTTAQGGKNKQTLKLSGTAKANSSVFLYVFSEPLVITTTSDANGNWVYTLEDPLQPGKHEVYAAVDRGDGKYEKSNPFSFAIGKAEAAADNPDGLSLRLESGATPAQSNRILYWYIACVVFVMSMAGIVLATIIHHHKTKNTPPSPPTPPNYTTPPTSFTPTPPSNGFAG